MSAPTTTKTDLLLLGLLLDRPMHGYELYQQIQSEGIGDWFNISAAGVYYSLGKMRDQGMVAESRQQGGRSSRKSIYRMTEKGRSSFFAAMEGHLASRQDVNLDYDLAIFLLNRLPLQRAMPCLEEQQALLAEQAQWAFDALAAEQDNGRSPLKLAILDHRRRYLEMEQTWLAGVISSLRDLDEGEGQGMMSLNGDLRAFHLPDLLRLIVSGQHSGTLTVTDGAESRLLMFNDGHVVCGAYRHQGQPVPSVLSPEEVRKGLCELFSWQEGQFTFEQGGDCPKGAVAISCSAEDLILHGCREVDNWSIIQRLVPSADTIFEPGFAAGQLGDLALTPTEERVVAAIDGVKDVNSIARDLDLTLFETCRVFYCLAAIGLLRAADPDKIRLRRVFREIAELICNSTLAWRSSPEDRTCEQEVNQRCEHLPIRIDKGRIQDMADPQLAIDELAETYRSFLQRQSQVVTRMFGRSNARQAYERALRQLAPELQDIAKRYGFDRLATD